MKLDFFKLFSFTELLSIRKRLCEYEPTLNDELDFYLKFEREGTTINSRTLRCITLIDKIIVSMAVNEQLMPTPVNWTIRVDLNDIEDSWYYNLNSDSVPSVSDVMQLIGEDNKIHRISSICIYSEFYYVVKSTTDL